MTLPKTPGPWSTVDRLNWLTMANSIFKTLYPSQDGADVEVVYKPEENK